MTTAKSCGARNRRRIGFTLAAAAMIIGAGCSSAERGDRQRSADALSAPRSAAPYATALAAIPGLEFLDLDVRPSDDAARMSLEDVLAEVQPAPPASVTGDSETDRDEVPRDVLALYIRGREARQEGRFADAARDLDAARRLDPNAYEILLELGRAISELGDVSTGMELFRRVLALKPMNAFAALMVMGDDVQWGRSQEVLERYVALTRPVDRFEHDAAAGLIADDMLRAALLDLGYDRAAIEVSRTLLTELASFRDVTGFEIAFSQLMEQRGQIALEAIDAALRMGDLEAAGWFVQAGVAEGGADSAGIGSRIVAIRLLRGELHELQRDLLAHWFSPRSVILDRDVRLAAFLREAFPKSDVLEKRLWESTAGAKNSLMYTRLAAASMRDRREARRLLEAVIDSDGRRDAGILRDLIAVARQEGTDSVMRMGAHLLERVPERAATITRAVASGMRVSPDIPVSAGSPRMEELVIRLRRYFNDSGGAWHRILEARRRAPDDSGLYRLQIELAGELDEPRFLEPLLASRSASLQDEIGEGSAYRPEVIWTQLLIAEALLRHGRAAEVAERTRSVRFALERSDIDDSFLRARAYLIEARAFAEQASFMDIGGRQRMVFEHAAGLGASALAADPGLRDAVMFLLHLHRPAGPLPDSERVGRMMRDLSMNPHTRPAVAGILAADHLQRGRFRVAQRYADFAVGADPLHDDAVATLVLALEHFGRQDVALRAIRQRMERQPGDLAALDQYLGLLVRNERPDEARRFLLSRLSEHPDDRVALGRLEVLARTMDRDDEALRLGLERLETLPPGSRRSLQRASLFAQTGLFDEAIDAVGDVVRDDAVPYRHLTLAMSLLGQLPRPAPGADELTVEAAELLLSNYRSIVRADVVSAALVSLARLQRKGDVFDRMVGALLTMTPMRDPGMAGVIQMRELSQRLIFAGSVSAAARVLEARMLSVIPTGTEELAVLASMQLVTEAASDLTGARTLALLDRLDVQGLLPILPGLDGVSSLTEAVFVASQISMMLGNDDGALRLLEHVVTMDPSLTMAKNNLGYLQIELGRVTGRTRELVRAAGEAHREDVNVRDTVAWLAYHDEDFDRAERMLAEIASGPDAASEVLSHWGDALYRVGRREEAKQAWQSALERLREETGERLRMLEQFRAMQVRGWGLLVVDPEVLYDRQVTVPRARLEAKIAAVRAGSGPKVAPTFFERGIRIEGDEQRPTSAGATRP